MLFYGTATEVEDWVRRWNKDRGWGLVERGPGCWTTRQSMLTLEDAYPGMVRVEVQRFATGDKEPWPLLFPLLKTTFVEVPAQSYPPGEIPRIAAQTLAAMPPGPTGDEAKDAEVLGAWKEERAGRTLEKAVAEFLQRSGGKTKRRGPLGAHGNTLARIKDARKLVEAGVPKTEACRRAGVDTRTYDRYVEEILDWGDEYLKAEIS